MKSTNYKVRQQYQPTNSTCSPTALSVLLGHYGKKLDPLDIEAKVPQSVNDKGEKIGTINQQLATWCLSNGFKVVLYTFDCQIIDQSWGELDTEQQLERMKLRKDGWATLQSSDELQTRLLDKLRAAGHDELADSLDISAEVRRSSKFEFRTDTLVHYDVRADNCAWNAAKNQVKLVDWNWAQYGDPRVDSSALLTQVQKSGLDISKTQASRLDADALQWLAGFWFNAAATPIWEGGPEHLRDFQLESGATAYKLMAGL